jgi:hypothetical protein
MAAGSGWRNLTIEGGRYLRLASNQNGAKSGKFPSVLRENAAAKCRSQPPCHFQKARVKQFGPRGIDPGVWTSLATVSVKLKRGRKAI